MKTAFLFSGQGAQYPGMYKELYESYEEVAVVMNKADEILGRKITAICFEGTQEELNLTRNTQPCVLATELAAAELLIRNGVEPDAVAGFSLGEYAAVTVAGVISKEDVFPIIQYRADIMQEAVPEGEGGMAAFIGAEQAWLESVCSEIGKEKVSIANYNSPTQIVLAGTRDGIREALERAKRDRVKALPLAVSVPSHCMLMEKAAQLLGNRLLDYSFHQPQIPVYMNYNGEMVENKEHIKEFLKLQLSNAVQWVKTLNNMRNAGIDTFIECGPGKVLSGLVKKTLKDVKILHVEDIVSFQEVIREWKN